ncbi:hypothetical protein MPER_01761 [Moniliophthora perniciosa FA553]|nr:hypothetical protein MPER_01761 [Moniliophthora perniciosa FA553]
MVSPNVSHADANTTFTPFAEFLQSKSNDSDVSTMPFESFYTWYRTIFATRSNAQVGINVELASRFLSRSLYETERDKMASVFLDMVGGVALSHVAGGAVSRADPDSVGVNPAWRDAVEPISNEASLYERNFQHTFFGNHYDRLLAIKDQYDPSGLFVVPEGVGSERWDESLNCRKY